MPYQHVTRTPPSRSYVAGTSHILRTRVGVEGCIADEADVHYFSDYQRPTVMRSEEEDKLLPALDGEIIEETMLSRPTTKATRSRAPYWAVATQSLIILLLIAGWLASLQWSRRHSSCQVVYCRSLPSSTLPLISYLARV